jgi:hypothetical protein
MSRDPDRTHEDQGRVQVLVTFLSGISRHTPWRPSSSLRKTEPYDGYEGYSGRTRLLLNVLFPTPSFRFSSTTWLWLKVRDGSMVQG